MSQETFPDLACGKARIIAHLAGQFGSDQIWFGWLCPQGCTWRF